MLDDANPDDELTLDAELPEGDVAPEPDAEQAEPESELVITIGDDAEEDDDGLGEEIDTSGMGDTEARTVTRLRDALKVKAKAAKEAERKAATAEAALAARDAAAKPKIEEKPYPKPIDYGYDDTLHEAAVIAWTENQVAVKAEKARQADADKAAHAEFTARVEKYSESKRALRVPDYGDAEASVMADMTNEQQQMILRCAGDPAKLVYALGRSPKARAELAAIKEWDRFAYRLAKIEGEIKVTQKTPPPPEARLKGGAGSGSGGGSIVAQLKAAEKRAETNGIRTEVIRLKSQARAAGMKV